MRRQAGFTLIELIACIVILGIVGFGMTTVISMGARSFFSARNADNAGPSAQLALERIALELRDVNGGGGAGGEAQVLGGTRIVYTTSQAALPGMRTLKFEGNAITLTPATGATARTLLNGVDTCAMSFNGTGRGSTLTVTFTLQNAPTGESFSITVKPRSNTLTPVTS
ncbi:MAG: prepilin-type N-terminal cleavage/methylation domain-containing protein [Proteobacteria bacterium]|nr:prepilin-type N-terminal cleavage/methylation domain-containing protein [Pseudomonadota bacterium]MBU1595918.1 prepilin-type N-terminal cleavage/methylation domain-containing protein [Pseudomonadota bacterium]